jgi:mRNA interferase HicA
MTGNEFIRKVRRIGRRRGVPVRFDERRGKGDHGVLWYGERFTYVGDRGELKTGTLRAMLKQLGLGMGDLRE